MWSQKDLLYFLRFEEKIQKSLVDLADYGFVIDHACFSGGWTKDSRCLARPAVAEALVKARRKLPRGYNFLIWDAWRPASLQKRCSNAIRRELRSANPNWSRAEMAAGLMRFCPPPADIMLDFASHRHGGSLDLTVVDASGKQLDMGAMGGLASASLLYYDRLPRLTPIQRRRRNNRHLMAKALEDALFVSLMVEWWHWSLTDDLYIYLKK